MSKRFDSGTHSRLQLIPSNANTLNMFRISNRRFPPLSSPADPILSFVPSFRFVYKTSPYYINPGLKYEHSTNMYTDEFKENFHTHIFKARQRNEEKTISNKIIVMLLALCVCTVESRRYRCQENKNIQQYEERHKFACARDNTTSERAREKFSRYESIGCMFD